MRRRARDQQPEIEPQEDDLVADEEYPVDRLKARVNESLGGRPFTVYLVLFAGAATLLLLLAVVWISATGDDGEDEIFCTQISPADARVAVLSGNVERVNILVDNDRPTDSLTGIQLRFGDQTCRQTPQGADIRDQLYSVIGAVELFNNFNDGSIDLRYQEQEIQPELLATSTPTVLPTETMTTTPTVEATPIEPTATESPPTEAPTTISTAEVIVPAAVTPTPTEPSVTPGATTDDENSAPVGNPGV